MEHTDGLTSLENALSDMLSRVSALTDSESVPLIHALHRVTAEAVYSPLNVPGFDNAAMDGYAIRLADVLPGGELLVAGKALAGQPFTGEWPPGTCLRIMTGAPIPAGCDAVVMQEEVTPTATGIRLRTDIKAGQNIRRQGQDIRRGAVALDAGQKLSSAELPLLASLGVGEVTVVRRLKVAIFSTGDELQLPGQPLGPGEIYDTNRLAVHLMAEQLGCEVINLGIIRDNPAALRQAFRDADQLADVTISTGGVSVGEADYTRQILNELGEIVFWKLAIKPGKPFAFGRLSRSWFCGLPGNPVSAVLTFYQLVQPLLAKLSGQSSPPAALRLRALAATPFTKTPGRLDFQRGVLTTGLNGELNVRTTGHQGSHIFSSFSQANCFVVLERERGAVAAGEWVEVEPFNALLGR